MIGVGLVSGDSCPFGRFAGEKGRNGATWRMGPHLGYVVRMGPPFISHKRAIWKGEQPYLRDLVTMVINHLLVLG